MSDSAGKVSGKKPASKFLFDFWIFDFLFLNVKSFEDIVGGMRVSHHRVRQNSINKKSFSESDSAEENEKVVILSQNEENQQVARTLEKELSSDPIKSFHNKPMPQHEMNHNKPRAAQHKNLFQPRK